MCTRSRTRCRRREAVAVAQRRRCRGRRAAGVADGHVALAQARDTTRGRGGAVTPSFFSAESDRAGGCAPSCAAYGAAGGQATDVEGGVQARCQSEDHVQRRVQTAHAGAPRAKQGNERPIERIPSPQDVPTQEGCGCVAMRKGLEATRANSAVRACVCAIVFVCACLCVCGVRWLGGLFGIVWAVFNTSGVLKPPPVVPPFCPHSPPKTAFALRAKPLPPPSPPFPPLLQWFSPGGGAWGHDATTDDGQNIFMVRGQNMDKTWDGLTTSNRRHDARHATG